MPNTLKIVYSNHKYIALAIAIFSSMTFGLLLLSEYIFLEPYFVGHIPNGTEFGFSLILIISGLSGLVLPMNIFRINILKDSKRKIGGSVIGSFLGSAAGACSCGPIGFALISTFGSIGGTASAFLTNYEIPIRLGAIAVLAIAYYTTVKSLKVECKIKQ